MDVRSLALACLASSCAAPVDAADASWADAPTGPLCPDRGVAGTGRHRLFVQGHGGQPRADGRYPLLHERTADGADAPLCDDRIFVDDTSGDGRWQPGEEPRPLGPTALRHGEHFLVGAGAFVELAIELCDDLTGELALYVPNFDEKGSRTLHQVIVVDAATDAETVIAEVIDEEAGQSGYNPFVRVLTGVDPDAHAGDLLLLRSTNLNGVPFSVMVWRPPSEYESWILVEVP